ncbi:MAG: 4Fe-4S ferredoxin [Thermoleophilia bacterium]
MAAFVWGPTIDSDACDGCRTCLKFCQQEVYGFSGGKVKVVKQDACIPGCSHCAGLCENAAISFPSLEDYRRMKATAAR